MALDHLTFPSTHALIRSTGTRRALHSLALIPPPPFSYALLHALILPQYKNTSLSELLML